ncbi:MULTISPECIES: hypothetical protein [unclassified Agromyces]|uniref:hypothetical protein n=1 Tax=unclassified Agromyces TaxID=2639701 RepID=UPI0030142475
MNLQHLLDDERRREQQRQERWTPRHIVALLVGAVGAAIVLGTGGALTAAAVSEINGYEQQTAASTALPDASPAAPDAATAPTPATTDPDPSASPAPASGPIEGAVEPAPGGIATILGYTVYDETSDPALIPRPPAEVFEEWGDVDVETILMQNHLDAVCMAEKGFKAAYVAMWQTWENGDTFAVIDELDAFNDARNPEWEEAMWGAPDQPLGEDYDWKQAGCHGASVHATGMDDAN